MRLRILDQGHRPLQKVALRLFGLASPGSGPSGLTAALSYRRQFFGKHMAGCLQEAMTEANHWSIPELEMMASFVSELNGLEPASSDRSTGTNSSDRLQATLAFLEKVTRTPADVHPADVSLVRAAGVADEAITEALYVSFVYGTLNRLAGAFDFPSPAEAGVSRSAKFFGRFRYRLASLPG